MPRTLYSPRLSDDIVRLLYREGKRRRIPMTRLADELLRQALDNAGVSHTEASEPSTANLVIVTKQRNHSMHDNP